MKKFMKIVIITLTVLVAGCATEVKSTDSSTPDSTELTTTTFMPSIDAPGASQVEKVNIVDTLLADGGTLLLTVNDASGNLREIAVENSERFPGVEKGKTYLIYADESGAITDIVGAG